MDSLESSVNLPARGRDQSPLDPDTAQHIGQAADRPGEQHRVETFDSLQRSMDATDKRRRYDLHD